MTGFRRETLLFLVLVVANITALMMINVSTVPATQWPEVYYPRLMFDQFLMNIGLGLLAACAKRWKIAKAFGYVSLLPLMPLLMAIG